MYGHFFDRSVYAKDSDCQWPGTYLNTCCIKCSECVCVYVKTSNRDYFVDCENFSFLCIVWNFIGSGKKKNYFQWQRIGRDIWARSTQSNVWIIKNMGGNYDEWRGIKLELS